MGGRAIGDDRVGDGDGDADTDAGGRSLRYHADGDLALAESASVPVTGRNFLHGDAASEILRAYGGEVFHWGAHAGRLAETYNVFGMDHGLSDDDLRARIDEALVANDLDEAYARLSVTYGSQGGRLTPAEAVDPRVVVIVGSLSRGGRGFDPAWDGPATVQTTKTRRIPDWSLPAWAKTRNYLNGILACAELRVTGADEALILGADGHATEGVTSNFFFVDDNVLYTLSLDGPVLPGITRRVALDLARQEGIPIRERRFAPDDVHDANEAFLANLTWEPRSVETVDGIEVDDGPVTKLLSRPHDDYVERRHYGGDEGSDDADNGGDADSVGGDEN